MKTKRLLISFFVLFTSLFALTACGNLAIEDCKFNVKHLSDLYEVGEDWNANDVVLSISYSDGTERIIKARPSMFVNMNTSEVGEHVATIRYGSFKYEFKYNVVVKKTLDVVFIDRDVERHQSVTYGKKITIIPTPSKELGYDFDGWYLGEEKFDPNMIVTEDLKITARFVINLEEQKIKNCKLIEDYAENIKLNYDEEIFNAILEVVEESKTIINGCETYDEVLVAVEEFYKLIEQIPTFSDLLDIVFQLLPEDSYFAEDYDLLEIYYEDAKDALDSYKGGAPIPRTIYNDAIDSFISIVTKEEDAKLAVFLKESKLRDFNLIIAKFERIYYSDIVLENLDKIIKDTKEAITKATYRFEVVDAYNHGLDLLETIKESIGKDAIIQLAAYVESIDKSLYFDAQIEELYEVFKTYAKLLANIDSQDKTAEEIIEDAKVALSKVMTKADDAIYAKKVKEEKKALLEETWSSLDKTQFSEKALLKIRTTIDNVIAKIEAADGSEATNKAYTDGLKNIKFIIYRASLGIYD